MLSHIVQQIIRKYSYDFIENRIWPDCGYFEWKMAIEVCVDANNDQMAQQN